jgi:hypothetical protein
MRRRLYERDHPSVANSLTNLADGLLELGGLSRRRNWMSRP